MLYSFVLLVIGVYLGQEFEDIPNIRNTFKKTIKFIKTKEKKDDDSSSFKKLFNW
jgi:hypothetical protein